jgi:hypothetical protein
MDPADILFPVSVASHADACGQHSDIYRRNTSTATILLNNFDRRVFNFYLLSFILANALAFKTIPDSLYLQSFFSPGFLITTHQMDK